jgi:flagellar hook-length control protein FliK
MLNLAAAPIVKAPGSQIPENFPTIGTGNYQHGLQKSDFSKTLANAVNLHSSGAKTKISLVKADTSSDFDKQVDPLQDPVQSVNNLQPIKHPKVTLSKVKESKLTQSSEVDNGDDTSTTEASSLESVLDSDDKTAPTKPKQNQNAMDSASASALLTPAFVEQPAVVEATIPNETTKNNVITSVAATSSAPVNVSDNILSNGVSQANGLADKITNGNQGRILDTAAMTTIPGQMAANDVKTTPIVPGNIPVPVQNASPSVQQTVAVTNSALGTTAAVQNLESQSTTIAGNLLSSTADNQQTVSEQDKTKGINNLKVGEVLNGKATEIQTPVVALKPGDVANQSGDSHKGVDNVLVAVNLNQDTPHPAVTDKGARLGDSLVANQVSGKNGKVQTLNLPVIQTQLLVNNSTDKARTDIALVAAVHQQQTADFSTKADINAVTVDHVNKDDLFAQIVEKAKVSINHGNGEMEVSLKPEHLGKLHLKISVENQLVTAKFVAESQQVKEVIETNLNQLRRNLQDTGIQVDQLMVSVGQHNNDGAFQDASHNSGSFAQHSNSPAINQEVSAKSLNNNAQEKRSRGETVIDLIA